MKNNVSIGLLGLGVVGSGVIRLIEDHQEELVHQLGCGVDVKGVLVRNLEKTRDVQVDRSYLTTDPNDVLHNPEIDVIVEVMGGIDEARKYILEAFATRKHVVTANKDLIALHGQELQEAASRNQCDLFYEASVAGGIPILRGLVDGLVSDRIQQVMGIVNGTTNYILTKMNEEGVTYEDALKEAQELGFAEADPTADVEGLDAARKMAILSRLAFSTDVELEDVEVKGIANLELADLQYGKQLGYTMKLIGYSNFHNQHVEVSVQPTFLSNQHPLAAVKNEYNAVYVNGEAVGETMFYGAGAGSLPTATAIMSDVVAVITNMRLGVNGRRFVSPRFKKELTPPEERFGQFYIRMHVKDEVGAFAAISHVFNQMDISFERILQIPRSKTELAEVILITHRTALATFQESMNKLYTLDVVASVESSFRVEGDGKK
ncbi:homoserine dehydrogenase [Virgibacillus dakarensis]|uniref:Homoserine dehydrogenase n=1 Tax=Lentibacillus populi TaxID=1827502 RepID=A0A9W5U0V8_9BACI|nr:MULTISPECIES: homoserine dehydrogenase [Bacillaceae]MBT2216967.1 homoserine dehydrogenase [Virgibacillus dakarensis]MTW87891.1 homoserine dehydrogenase [Virgibacillus dakarensis]GGB58765.1 homoserine dehydrogenase [Lentibacillus populi]